MAYSKNPWTYRDVSDHARMVSWFQAMETGIASGDGAPFPALALQAWVDYANGSDSNNGLSPSSAFKTIQAAYNALQTTAEAGYSLAPFGGIGRINLFPGDHEVGAGLVFPYTRGVELMGVRSGGGSPDLMNSASRIVSSSSTATEMVKFAGSTGQISRGFRFQDIAFRPNSSVNTALTKVIYGGGNYLNVQGCSFRNTAATQQSWTHIYHESQGDASYVRITGNYSDYGQLYWAPASPDGTNYNRGNIDHNVVFYSGSVPSVNLEGNWQRGSVSFNNFEGSATAVSLGSASKQASDNVFISNGGEDSSLTHPFYDVVHGFHNVFIGGTTTAGGSNVGTWIHFAVSVAVANTVIGQCNYVGEAGYKAKAVDDNSPPKNTIISTYGDLALSRIPTADPHVVGAVWSNGGILTVSAG